MIAFTLYRAEGETLAGFSCEGHAGHGKFGQDIVCAAVSMIAITSANALEQVAGAHPETSQGDGALKVWLAPEERTRDTQVILETLLLGVRQLQDAYPQSIRVTQGAAERRK